LRRYKDERSTLGQFVFFVNIANAMVKNFVNIETEKSRMKLT